MTAEANAGLSAQARRWLLGWARESIAAHLARRSAALAEDRPQGVSTPRGCFVTLRERSGELRGCIGSFEALPLWENVAAMAVASATRDPRFAPMQEEELPGCVVEISVLSPRAPISPAEVRVGVHGLWIVRGGQHGVLLPQVPLEYGWDRETFLAHTCRKAGLPRDAWRDPETHLEAFTAEVFGEVQPGEPEER